MSPDVSPETGASTEVETASEAGAAGVRRFLTVLRWVGVAALVPLGAVLTVSAAVVTRMDVRYAGVTWPLGLIFVLAAAIGFLGVVGPSLGRAGRVAAGAGWAAGLVLCMWPRPEGDFVIAADWTGTFFVVFSIVGATWTAARALIAPAPVGPSARGGRTPGGAAGRATGRGQDGEGRWRTGGGRVKDG